MNVIAVDIGEALRDVAEDQNASTRAFIGGWRSNARTYGYALVTYERHWYVLHLFFREAIEGCGYLESPMWVECAVVLGDQPIHLCFLFEMAHSCFLLVHEVLAQILIRPGIDEVLERYFFLAVGREINVYGHLYMVLEEAVPVCEGSGLSDQPEGVHKVAGVALDIEIMLLPDCLQSRKAVKINGFTGLDFLELHL